MPIFLIIFRTKVNREAQLRIKRAVFAFSARNMDCDLPMGELDASGVERAFDAELRLAVDLGAPARFRCELGPEDHRRVLELVDAL